jgi:lysophospholipase L1-like esterase
MYVPSYGSKSPTAARVLCYGDSNTIGFCEGGSRFQPYAQALSEALAAAGGPCEVVACGLCGLTANDMKEGMNLEVLHPTVGPLGKGLVHLLEKEGPFDLVIIMAGTNDIGSWKNVDEAQTHVENLHEACHKYGISTVNLAPPAAVSIGGMRAARQRLADLMDTLASKEFLNVVLNVDVEELLPRNVAAFWEPDEIHLSSQGSNELGRLLAPMLAPHLTKSKQTRGRGRAARARSFSPLRRCPSVAAHSRSRSPHLSPLESAKRKSDKENAAPGVTQFLNEAENLLKTVLPASMKGLPEKNIPDRLAAMRRAVTPSQALQRDPITISGMQHQRRFGSSMAVQTCKGTPLFNPASSRFGPVARFGPGAARAPLNPLVRVC